MLYIKEYVATVTATLSVFSSGLHYGWLSPTIPFLKSDASPIKITDDEGSWIVSIMLLGCIFGPIPTGYLMNRIGRKLTVVLSAIPYLLAWILILVADSVAVLYVAQFLAGFGNAGIFTVIPIYLGEIASDRIRGALGTFLSTMSNLGIVIAYSLGSFVPYGILPYILILPPIGLLLSYFILPESPYYHLMKHREEEAMATLKYLRSNKKVIELQPELDSMNKSVKMDQENKASFKELFYTKGNRKATFILFGCFFGQQFCGSMAVLGYAQEIFEEADGVLGSSESAIILGVAQVVAALVSSLIIDRIGRRPLLLGSAAGVTITSAIMGGYLYVKEYLESDVTDISWLPIAVLVTYIISFTIGLATVPYILMGEMFPTNVKAIAAAPFIMLTSAYAFVVTKLFQVVSDAFGTYVTFWGFSVLSFLSLIHIFMTLPETRKKSLVDIQIQLNK